MAQKPPVSPKNRKTEAWISRGVRVLRRKPVLEAMACSVSLLPKLGSDKRQLEARRGFRASAGNAWSRTPTPPPPSSAPPRLPTPTVCLRLLVPIRCCSHGLFLLPGSRAPSLLRSCQTSRAGPGPDSVWGTWPWKSEFFHSKRRGCGVPVSVLVTVKGVDRAYPPPAP